MDLEPVVSTSTARSQRRRLWGRLGVGVILIAALVIALASLALAADGFPDVPASHQYYTAITDLSSRGIILGYDNGNFGPSAPVMRQQFAKMIVLTGQYPVSEANVCPFMDVESSGPGELYPDNYVAVCAAKGITLGKTETTFQPYGYITRLQVTSMVVRAANDLQAGLLASPPAGWSGNAAWAADPDHGANAAKAEYNGLLDGLDLAALSPYGNMTRGEVAQVLHNLLVKLGTSPGTTGSTTPTTYTLAISASPAAGGSVAASPNQTTFNAGSTVTLTATPATGYTFSGWSGNASGTANPLTVTMNSNKSIVANFTAGETFTLTASVPGGHGTVTRSPSKAEYNEGESVVLTPVPSSGYVFHHWGGDATGTAKPLTVVMDSDKAIEAFFAPAPTYTLTIIRVGAGTSTVARIPAQISYYEGESVTLTAYPADGYVFSYWSGDHNGTSNPATVVMDSDKTIYANFRELNTYTLSIVRVGAGTSTVTRTPSKSTYYEGESVTLTANPATGYVFSYWSGDHNDTSNPATVVMDSNKTIYANFRELTTYTLSIEIIGYGTVTRSPNKPTFYAGESVTLTANPGIGYLFVRWWGSISSTNNPCTFTMNANKAVKVTFEHY